MFPIKNSLKTTVTLHSSKTVQNWELIWTNIETLYQFPFHPTSSYNKLLPLKLYRTSWPVSRWSQCLVSHSSEMKSFNFCLMHIILPAPSGSSTITARVKIRNIKVLISNELQCVVEWLVRANQPCYKIAVVP